MTTARQQQAIERSVHTPRSAALAGIAFALLMLPMMFVVRSFETGSPGSITSEELQAWTTRARLVLGAVPFAGLAFLWFTGVIRDRLGEHEDRFFSTVFFGSGIITIVMMFMWAATLGAVYGAYLAVDDPALGRGIIVFGFALINQIVDNYSLRMAGVYMMSIATLWSKTGVMPRWLILITVLLALAFLLFANAIREARMLFPGWVLLISVYVLVRSYSRQDQG